MTAIPTSTALPADLEDQIARMEQATLHPHDWTVLRRKVATAIGAAEAREQELAKQLRKCGETGANYFETIERLTAELEAARKGLFSHLTGEHQLAEPTYAQLKARAEAAEAQATALQTKLDNASRCYQFDVVRLQAETTALREALTDCLEAGRAAWSMSPEGRAFIARLETALHASPAPKGGESE